MNQLPSCLRFRRPSWWKSLNAPMRTRRAVTWLRARPVACCCGRWPSAPKQMRRPALESGVFLGQPQKPGNGLWEIGSGVPKYQQVGSLRDHPQLLESDRVRVEWSGGSSRKNMYPKQAVEDLCQDLAVVFSHSVANVREVALAKLPWLTCLISRCSLMGASFKLHQLN